MVDALRIAIGIPTAGRAQQMHLTLRQLKLQTMLPVRTIVCPAGPADFDESAATDLNYPLQVISAPARGLCVQRNAILAAATDIDILVFIDDDYYPAADYLAQIDALFRSHPDLVVSTNQPDLDGATGPGVSHEEALKVIAGIPPMAIGGGECAETYGGYGCNMGLRMSAVFEHQVRFDERLPLYAWLEDIDFSRRMAPYGRVANSSALRGVHLAVKSGRTVGLRLGYSQVANPVYMVRKGSMSISYAGRQMSRNLANNLLRFAYPEPWIDRRGRVKGNALAVWHLLTNRLDPERILAM